MPKALTDYSERLRPTKNAYFLKKDAPLSNDIINTIFDGSISDSGATEVGKRVVRRNKTVESKRCTYSLLIFRVPVQPPFLEESDLEDLVHGFLLICELDSIVVVFRSRANLDDSLFGASVSRFPYEKMSRLFGYAATAYEKINLTMMSVNQKGLRAKSFEASDLKYAMPTLGASRSIPRHVRLRSHQKRHSITPGTSRVATYDHRVKIATILEWCLELQKEFSRRNTTLGFMNNFATPCELNALGPCSPTGILLNLRAIHEDIEHGGIRRVLFRPSQADEPRELSLAVRTRLLQSGNEFFPITSDADGHNIWRDDTHADQIGQLNIKKTVISLASELFDRFIIERADTKTITLTQYVNSHQDFVVCFTDPLYAYFNNQLFRDHGLLNNIPAFLELFTEVPQLNNVNDEKGKKFAAASTQFPDRSIFRVICDHISVDDTSLICDDLGDEWADMMGLNQTEGVPTITFYAAKHGEESLGAGPWQVVVAQAQKNFGRFNVTADEIRKKVTKCDRMYKHKKIETQINLLIRGGTSNQLRSDFERAISHPRTVRKYCLVVSFASKTAITKALTALTNGDTSRPYLTQFLWLVTAFASACREAGAVPEICCKP